MAKKLSRKQLAALARGRQIRRANMRAKNGGTPKPRKSKARKPRKAGKKGGKKAGKKPCKCHSFKAKAKIGPGPARDVMVTLCPIGF